MYTYADWGRLNAQAEDLMKSTSAISGRGAKEQRALTQAEQADWDAKWNRVTEIKKQMRSIERSLIAAGTHKLDSNDDLVDIRQTGREDTVDANGKPIMNRRTNGTAASEAEKMGLSLFLRGGINALPSELRMKYEAKQNAMSSAELEQLRDMTVGTPSGGGYMVPQAFLQELDVALRDYSGMLQACDYWDTEDGAAAPVPSINDTANTGERVAENGAFSADQDPVIGSATMATTMYSSRIVKVSIQLLQDSTFDIEATLRGVLAERIGRILNTDLTVGDGTNKPRGIVTDAPTGFTNFPATSISVDDLLDLEHSVDPAYRPGAGWMMHDQTFKVIEKLKDSQNRPIFIADEKGSITGTSPGRLRGYPVFINQAMATPAAAARTLLFGQFKKYLVRRVRQVTLFRFNEAFMANGQIGFLMFARFGGLLRHPTNGAVKALVQGAS